MVQTRNEVSKILNHDTLEKAFDHTLLDTTVWKISFDAATGERVRLIKTSEGWTYEDIMGERRNHG